MSPRAGSRSTSTRCASSSSASRATVSGGYGSSPWRCPRPATRYKPMTASGFRSGFVTVVGRPNVGKSTLVNQLVGTKVTITSPRPNTTRRVVRGIVHRPGVQIVLVDTPGLHRPRSALGERLNDQVTMALAGVDVPVAVVEATSAIGPGDR